MSYDNLSSVSQNVLKFYQLLTSEERRMPFIFDDFHFCRSRVIELDMTENRIFTLCRMITWVVFLRMFWNFISSLLVKRGGFLSILVGTISNVLVMEIGWTDVGSGGYILVSCAHSNTCFNGVLNPFHKSPYSQIPYIILLFIKHQYRYNLWCNLWKVRDLKRLSDWSRRSFNERVFTNVRAISSV
jgi:hypothetical protein